ncbi:hypothetical protein EMIT0P265_60298 [Pseudomonas zeae]
MNLAVHWRWNAERPGMRYHAERGNDQDESGGMFSLEEKSGVAVGKIIPDRRSSPRSAWECSRRRSAS